MNAPEDPIPREQPPAEGAPHVELPARRRLPLFARLALALVVLLLVLGLAGAAAAALAWRHFSRDLPEIPTLAQYRPPIVSELVSADGQLTGEFFEERRKVLDAAHEMGALSSTRQAWVALTLYGHQRPEDWAEIMHQVVHVHAKFYEIDEDGNEPSIAYDRLVRVFRDGGYTGYLSSEWEGAVFASDVDPFDIVRRQQELMRRHLAAEVVSA